MTDDSPLSLFDMPIETKSPPRPAQRLSKSAELDMLFKMLSEALGGDTAAEAFMRSLPGCVIRIPPAAEVESMIVARRAARSSASDPSDARTIQLQQFFGIPRREITRASERYSGKQLSDAA